MRKTLEINVSIVYALILLLFFSAERLAENVIPSIATMPSESACESLAPKVIIYFTVKSLNESLLSVENVSKNTPSVKYDLDYLLY